MFATLKKPLFFKIYLIPLFTMCIGSMSFGISVLYALELGANILQINLITTIRSTMGIFLLVPFGILSDRFGRKPMIIYPRVIMWLGTLIRAFASEPNHLLIASFVGGFAGGNYMPILLSMIADIAKPEEQQESISILFFFSSIGMVTGPLITTLLLNLPQITIRSIYQITAIAEILIITYLATHIRETKPTLSSDISKGFRASIMGLLRQSRFQSLIVMTFFYFLSRSIIQTYIPIYARIDLSLSDTEISSLAVYRNLAIVLIRLLSATLLTKVSIKPYLFSVVALGGLVSLVSPLADTYLFIVILFFLSGMSHGAVRILSSTLVAKNSIPENRGIANSLLLIGQSSGNFMTVTTSPIADTFGLDSVFLFGGIIGLIAIIPALIS